VAFADADIDTVCRDASPCALNACDIIAEIESAAVCAFVPHVCIEWCIMACSNKPNHMPSITINKSAAVVQLSMGKSDVKNCETIEAAARLSLMLCDVHALLGIMSFSKS
jgi:hypothetical protein